MTVTRLSGLISGLDIDSLVKSAVSAQKTNTVDKAKQKEQILEWQQSDYRDINSKLLTLRNSISDLKLQSTFMTKTVTSSDETVLTATANANVSTGNYSIQVDSLASGVTKESTPASSSYTHAGTDKSFTLTGEKGSAAITVTSGDTITNIVSKINAKTSTTGIKASYDSGQNKFYLMTSNTGSQAQIQITDTDSFLSSELNVNTATQTGADAKITFNGGSQLSFSSNQFTFNNITFNLKKAGGSTADLSVSNDIDAVVSKIKTFVDAYNSTVDQMGTKLSESKYYDYAPLTDDQKSEMKDSDITLWQQKAQSGDLASDPTLSSIYNKTRMLAMGPVQDLSSDNQYTSLSAIGINTENYWDNGKLSIDEDQLREALSTNPDGVMELFTKNGTTADSEGIADRLYDSITNSMESIATTAGSADALTDNSTIGKHITELKTSISDMQDKLYDLETSLYNKYSAMETALEQLSAQSSQLSAILGTDSSS